jgi:hypothetical protein
VKAKRAADAARGIVAPGGVGSRNRRFTHQLTERKHVWWPRDTYDGADGASQACISQQGFMLRAEWSAGGQSARLEATEFSDDVSDEDFEAPYPVTG